MALTEIEEEHLQINSGCLESPRSYQCDSSSEPDSGCPESPRSFLSYLLERSPTPLDYRQPESPRNMWVFWSKKEESENRSSSADLHDKIKFAFGNIDYGWLRRFAQLWVPVTIGGRRLLSTSGQPFAVNDLSKRWAKYRLYSEKYEYDIDVNKQDDPKIKSDGPATAFLNRLPYICDLLESESRFKLQFRGFLPICLPSQSDCIGVLEFTSTNIEDEFVSEVLEVVKKAGLDFFNVQEQIPYKLFQGKGLSQNPKALEKGKQPIVVDSIAPSVVTCKTTSKLLPLKDMEKQSDDVIRVKTPVKKTMGKHNTSEIILPREDIEKHFDKPMKEAAKNLNVNLSTLKRKMKKHGIEGWPKRATRNKSELSINQIDANEEDSGAAQKPSAMIIKAEYADDTIKISHLNSQATFETINKEIGRRFNLSFGTYKLKYRDEDEDWILFTSDADLRDCIKCSRKSDRIVIRVRALPLTNVQI